MDRSFPEIQARTDEILARDFLYEDPASYREGVLAAVRLIAEAGMTDRPASTAAGGRSGA